MKSRAFLAAITMGILAFLGITSTHAELETGAALPDLTVTTHDGREIKLAAEASKGFALFFFYPKANTPGCTKQACSLRDASADLSAKGVKVFGVSFDSVDAQKDFAAKQQLPYPLLADPDGKIVAAFGVPATAKFAKRQAYLFKDGILVWRDLSASTDRQAADVHEAIGKL